MTTLVGALLFVGIGLALFVRKGAQDVERIRYAPRSEWELLHFCQATGAMIRASAPPREVAFDLGKLSLLSPPAIAALEHACDAWLQAGTPVTIEGCGLETAAALWRRGVRAEVRCASSPSTMLH